MIEKNVQRLNMALVLCLCLSAIGYIFLQHVVAFSMAVVALLLAAGVYKQILWAYFCTAAWAFGALQLGKTYGDFAHVKAFSMVAGLVLMVLAVYLHEKVKSNTSEETPVDSVDESE